MPKFISYTQPDTMDCGATCLRMIAKHYDRDYSLEELSEKCYTTREGVSLLSISETAEQIGFKTVGGRITFEKLIKEAPLPCIVHWNQEHFVVVYKIKHKSIFKHQTKLFVADPAYGLITFTENEFKNHWLSTQSSGEEKGVVLLLEPTQEFYKKQGEEKHKKSLNFLF